MLRCLTDWTISLASQKAARCWLAFIAFIESSVFPVPADVLFVPMAVIKPERAWRYAFIATFFSVLGGIAGWLLGYFSYEALAKPVLVFYGKYHEFEVLRESTSVDFIFLLLVSSGLTHLPPVKIVTILSGVAGINIWLFIILAILTRGARYYLLAWLIILYGTVVCTFLAGKSKFILILSAIVLMVAFLGGYKFIL